MTRAEQIAESIAHWEKLAVEAEEMVAWDRQMGFGPPAGITAPGEHKAKTYRDMAEALRLEAKTGEVHCACHHAPQSKWHEFNRSMR